MREDIDLRMVKMFFDKLTGIYSVENFLKEKIGEEVIKFSIRLVITMKDFTKAIELLERH